MNVGIEWLVAVLAPWAISIHPNFSEDDDSPERRLALVVESRENRFQTRSRSKSDDVLKDAASLDSLLVDSAARSLTFDGIETASAELWAYSQHDGLPWGARAAAAGFAALAESERENSDFAVSRLALLDHQLGDSEDIDDELRLIRAFIKIQLVTRGLEYGAYDAGRRELDGLAELIPDAWHGVPEFNVSRGISWGPARVMQDIVDSMRLHGLELRATLDRFEGQSWVPVVRGRSGWIDMRLLNLAASRDKSWIDREFDNAYEANSGVTHFGRSERIAGAHPALVAAELSGSVNKIRSAREAMAKLRALDLAAGKQLSSEEIEDCLRYLRQARQKAPLQHLLRRLRDVGPLKPLISDSQKIVARIERTGFMNDYDLQVLEVVAEFTEHPLRARFVQAILDGRQEAEEDRRSAAFALDRRWRALSRYMDSGELTSELLNKLREVLDGMPAVQQPFANTFLRVVARVDWENLSFEERQEWVKIVSDRRSDESEPGIWVEALRLVEPQRVTGVDFSGLERCALRVNGVLPKPSQAERAEEIASLVGALDTERAEAKQGSTSIGQFQASNVALAYGLRFDDDVVLNRVIAHLTDKNVSLALKKDALQRVAEQVAKLPPSAVDSLRAGWGNVEGSRSDPWGRESAADSAEVLSAGVALEIWSRDDVLARLVVLSRGDATQRHACATAIAFITEQVDSWASVIALQLVSDADPSVRGAVAFAIGRWVGSGLDVGSFLRSSILSELSSDGVRTKVGFLQGFAVGSRANPSTSVWGSKLVASITELASKDASASVRKLAAEVRELARSRR